MSTNSPGANWDAGAQRVRPAGVSEPSERINPARCLRILEIGEVAEWSNALVLKTSKGL